MPKGEKDKHQSAVGSPQKKKHDFTFFRRLPQGDQGSIQEEILSYMPVEDMARVAGSSHEMNRLAQESNSDYAAIQKGQKRVESHFKGCECDFIMIPDLPEDKNIEDYLLNVPPFTANAAYALVRGQHMVLLPMAPTELEVQNMKSQELLVYFEEDKFKYIVKKGPEKIRGELELQLEEAIVENNGQVSGYTVNRPGIRKKYYDELKEGIEKIRAGENYIPSEEARNNFFRRTKERQHTLDLITFFYVDRLKHYINGESSPFFRERMVQKFGSLNIAPNAPVPLSDKDVAEIADICQGCRSPGVPDHLAIKKAFLSPSVLIALGKNILTIEQALTLYQLQLLATGTSKAAFYALEKGLLTVENLITPPAPPLLPEGMEYLMPDLLAMTYKRAHQTMIGILLSPLGLDALERKLITVSKAHEFINDTREADQHQPGYSFSIFLSNEIALQVLEKEWLTLKSVARLSLNGSLMPLLTPEGLPLLQLLHEGKDQMNPRIRLEEILEFRWGYQLRTLLKNPYFIPAIRERKVRYSQLSEIQNEELTNRLLSPEGLRALEKGYLTTSQVNQLPSVNLLNLLLSPEGMKAFEEGIMEMGSVLSLIRHSKILGTENNLYDNLNLLLSKKGFFILDERYASLEVAAEINGLANLMAPSNLSTLKEALKSKLITMAEIHHLSADNYRLVRDLLSEEGLNKLQSDKTLVKDIIDRQHEISARSIPLLEAISERNDHYLQQLRNIQNGMAEEYGTAQEIVGRLVRQLSDVSELINNHRIDHNFLISKMSYSHQIQRAFDGAKQSLNDFFVQNAIHCDRFPSSGVLNALIHEVEEDPVMRNSISQIHGLQEDLRNLSAQEHQNLNLGSDGRTLRW